MSTIYLVKYLLEDPHIDHILLGLISSDYLESRFGWFRQLCGADYFNAVLQFLQAEKKIRLRCLVKDGFDFSQIEEIFRPADSETESSQVTCDGNMVLDEISVYSFENLGSISEEDRSTIFYTSGYIARSLAKRMKCDDCKIMLKAIDDEAPSSQPEEEKPRERYFDIANRGGLTKPSDALYMACVHAWGLYVCIKDNSQAWKLLLEACNTRSAFVHCYLEKMKLPQCAGIYDCTCASGCKLNSHLKKVAEASFNLKAKNFAAAKKDEINRLKRNRQSQKVSSSKKD